MHLLALGLNHNTAPIEAREKAAFTAGCLQQALTELTAEVGACEATILSTCNRTEIYCRQEARKQGAILDWLSGYSGLEPAVLAQIVYQFPDEEAVKHAFRVASGLDSMALGEPQILGQMKDAFQTAVRVGATGKILNRLFQHTFSVAKLVRTDTDIGANAVSLAYAGVSLAKRVFTRLQEQTALLIGAGEMIELVARHLKKNQVRHIIIANRSIKKAQTLTRETGSEAISLAQIPVRLPEADIVVTSTASALPILGKGAIEAALRKRKRAPMFILDLAVPRDVEAEAARLQDVYLYTVDDLRSIVDENRTMRLQASEKAENIIDLQVVKFMRWMRSLDAVPTIVSFREGLEDLKRAELARALRRLENGKDPVQVVEQLAHDLVNKVAHHPGQVIKQADRQEDANVIAAAKRLFNL